MINHITLKNYRNIKEFSSKLDNKTLIIAPNGTGKTNILESIYYVILGTSFKSINTNKDIIGPNGVFSKVTLELTTHTLESVISLNNTKSLKRIFKKNNKPSSLKSIKSDLVLIVFSPNSVDLVNGSPELRRNDLDMFLVNLNKAYMDKLSRYNKVLKNKNALLKNIRDTQRGLDQLSYWNNELSELAQFIVYKRLEVLKKLNLEVLEFFDKLYKFSSSFSLEYKQFKEFDLGNYKESLLNTFSENIQKEIVVGKTLYGPHKDDIDVLLDAKNVRYFGSRAQQRIATLIIKLAHMQYAFKNGFNTMLLIDDIFSELDKNHRENIAMFLTKYDHQIILTSADSNEVPSILKQNALVINL